MNEILIGKGETPVHLLAKYGNRHGLVAGATGTGKSVSLMVLAEQFSRLGVPVFTPLPDTAQYLTRDFGLHFTTATDAPWIWRATRTKVA